MKKQIIENIRARKRIFREIYNKHKRDAVNETRDEKVDLDFGVEQEEYLDVPKHSER